MLSMPKIHSAKLMVFYDNWQYSLIAVSSCSKSYIISYSVVKAIKICHIVQSCSRGEIRSLDPLCADCLSFLGAWTVKTPCYIMLIVD